MMVCIPAFTEDLANQIRSSAAFEACCRERNLTLEGKRFLSPPAAEWFSGQLQRFRFKCFLRRTSLGMDKASTSKR